MAGTLQVGVDPGGGDAGPGGAVAGIGDGPVAVAMAVAMAVAVATRQLGWGLVEVVPRVRGVEV